MPSRRRQKRKNDMDKKLYMVTNCSHIVKICDTEEEMNEEYRKLCEEESRYSQGSTHYYYGTEIKTRGEYVCDRLCDYVRLNLEDSQRAVEARGVDLSEYYTMRMVNSCRDCPMNKYSPFKEELDERTEEDS